MTQGKLKLPDFLGCFLCARLLQLKFDKKGKCYLICNSCGFQGFIRGQNGILKLAENKRRELFIASSSKESLVTAYNLLKKISEIIQKINPEIVANENILDWFNRLWFEKGKNNSIVEMISDLDHEIDAWLEGQ